MVSSKTVINKKRNLHIAITIAVMAFIFLQSALPGDISGAESNIFVRALQGITGMTAEQQSFAVRKTAHFTIYMILGGCLAVNVRDWRKSKKAEAACSATAAAKVNVDWAIAWVIGAAYAVTDEIHQAFVPERACALMDMGIDAAGAATGIAIMMCILQRRNR